jgi:hypothetical protein
MSDTGDAPRPPVPRNLTQKGMKEFEKAVDDFRYALAAELDARAARSRNDSAQEQTVEAVQKAVRVVHRRRGGLAGPGDLAFALLVIATVGVPVMASFLHSDWQRVVFAGFILTGLVGLVLAWLARHSGTGGGVP